MKNDKKSVLLYTEWAEPLKSLPLEEKGRIFDAILSYTENGRMPKFENPATDMAFRWIQQKLDENIQKWEETRAKRAAAGKSGGAPKGNSNAKKQEQPKQPNDSFDCSDTQEDEQQETSTGPPDGKPESYWVWAGCDKMLTPYMAAEFRDLREAGIEDALVVAALKEAMRHQAKYPWVYAKRLLDQAAAQKITTLEAWEKVHITYKGNRVDRETPSGNILETAKGNRKKSSLCRYTASTAMQVSRCAIRKRCSPPHGSPRNRFFPKRSPAGWYSTHSAEAWKNTLTSWA